MFVIAIDGPAASGKSSVSRLLARKLGCRYVNSGSFYRAITWAVLKEGIPLDDEAAISLFLTSLDIQCELEDGHTVILLNGSDPDLHLRDPEVNHSVSKVSSSPEVRRVLTEILRGLVDGGSLVMEGRDIGSVVFPDTPYKFYIDASEEVRASRRAAQGETDSIARRDALDSTRKNAPLIISEDAHVVDSSHLTLEGVVGEIIGRLRMKGLHVTL
ncbi:MAG TPA: (d)CMP kinase [Verrucomicrobiales bacterium]|jgi:cytidylate kinase|nr:(d)CMP kinase [Verrucomicrobiales bacterium]